MLLVLCDVELGRGNDLAEVFVFGVDIPTSLAETKDCLVPSAEDGEGIVMSVFGNRGHDSTDPEDDGIVFVPCRDPVFHSLVRCLGHDACHKVGDRGCRGWGCWGLGLGVGVRQIVQLGFNLLHLGL